MNDITIDPVFAEAFRAALVDEVATHRLARRRRRWRLGAGFLGAVVLLGGAGAATAQIAHGPRPPGTPIVVELPTSFSGTFTGTGTLELGEPPVGANAIEYRFTCVTPGDFRFENGSSTSCSSPSTSGEYPAGFHHPTMSIPADRGFTVETSPDARWTLTVAYITYLETQWGVNANGQTFGAEKIDVDGKFIAEPDLVPVYASNGKRGYAYKTDMQSPLESPDMPKFDNPSDAVAWVEEQNRLHDRFPVYKSDGVTVIGESVIGQAPAVLPEPAG
ncbi:hypothetical protein VD659_05310 [Herbiconiux sp. 11R-BC]|uniref:hypothetical protein n=1 Tax=Herbiconiux sp. 11R-BC TaxID=3111637 RepID=UPI003BFE22E3